MKRTIVNPYLILAAVIGFGTPLCRAIETERLRVERRLPADEIDILRQVAREYKLTAAQRRLLYGIRVLENGRRGSGIEMGVGQEQDGHRARRHAGNWRRSLLTQARWAAGTIKRRYTGDLNKFAAQYCPRNAETWAVIMRQLIGD
jgi:hypothetical protein